MTFKIFFAFYKQENFEENSNIYLKIFEPTTLFEFQFKSDITQYFAIVEIPFIALASASASASMMILSLLASEKIIFDFLEIIFYVNTSRGKL